MSSPGLPQSHPSPAGSPSAGRHLRSRSPTARSATGCKGRGRNRYVAVCASRSRMTMARLLMRLAANDADGDDAHQHRGNRVDLRRHAEAHLGVNLHRQRRRAGAAGERRDHQIVEREREGQEPAGDQRRADDRQRDGEEGLDRRCAQVHRGFFQRAVHGEQPRLHHHRHVGHREGDVGHRHGPVAARPGERDEEQQHRKAGDDLGHDQRRVDHAREQRAAGETPEPGEREPRRECPAPAPRWTRPRRPSASSRRRRATACSPPSRRTTWWRTPPTRSRASIR